MPAYPPPGSLRGLAQDLIVQVRGGHAPTDDEPLQEVQLIEWLRRAASSLLMQTLQKAEADDLPLADDFYRPLTTTLTPYAGLITNPAVRFKKLMLPALPLTLLNRPVVRNLLLTPGGWPVQVVANLSELLGVAKGWGRLKKPRPAAWVNRETILLCLPEFLWEASTVYLDWAPADPLRGVADNDVLNLPPGWIDAMLMAVTKGPLSITVQGIPDLINDAAATNQTPSQ